MTGMMRREWVVTIAALLCACGATTQGGTSKMQVRLAPVGLAELIEQGDRTRVAIVLPRAPVDPRVVVTIYQGTCAGDKKPVSSFESRPSNPDAPSSGGETLFEGVTPVSLAGLRGSPHAIGLMTDPASGNRPIACGDIK
jgi:hypothetical protein